MFGQIATRMQGVEEHEPQQNVVQLVGAVVGVDGFGAIFVFHGTLLPPAPVTREKWERLQRGDRSRLQIQLSCRRAIGGGLQSDGHQRPKICQFTGRSRVKIG